MTATSLIIARWFKVHGTPRQAPTVPVVITFVWAEFGLPLTESHAARIRAAMQALSTEEQ
ncbi:MAG TPA: hypothetical protein VH762_03240 [Gemmatimonadaceae bacterium]|jgi:hypothetical protein